MQGMRSETLPSWWSNNMPLQPALQALIGSSGWSPPLPHAVRVKDREPDVALGAIKAYVAMRQRLDQALRVEVASARAAGCSWPEVARVLGVTHQAAIRKYAKVDPHYADRGPDALT